MALDACVKNIVCTLSLPVLSALDALIMQLLAEINAQLAAVIASLAVLEITLAPLELAADAAQAVKDQFDTLFTLIPVNVINECVDMGNIMQTARDVIDRRTAELDDFLADTVRQLSVKDELLALQDSLTINRDKFTELQTIITECKEGAT